MTKGLFLAFADIVADVVVVACAAVATTTYLSHLPLPLPLPLPSPCLGNLRQYHLQRFLRSVHLPLHALSLVLLCLQGLMPLPHPLSLSFRARHSQQQRLL